MCHARRVTSEPAVPAEPGAVPDLVALTRVVARQRAEMDRLQDLAAVSAVLERAKGALMALTGCTPDAAHEDLQQRAKAAHRTLLEECWITLGNLAPPLRATLPDMGPNEAGAETAETASDASDPVTDDDSATLGRLAQALARVGGTQDLARCLLEHLAPDTGAEAVMVYARLPAGGLELVGHAGIDETLAAQWRQVPPLSGIAALDALRTGRERWLEDIEKDREQYLLIGDPPERWGSRAWLPVPPGGSADLVLGVLRGHDGPFPPSVRGQLRATARLCAGWLRAVDVRHQPPGEGAADTVQAVFDGLPGAAVLLSALRAPSGEIEDYRIDAATAETADGVGRSGRELVGLRFLECWPAVASEALWQGCLRALATGEPYEGQPFARQHVVAGVTELSTYSVRVAKLGDGLIVTWIRHEPSDRQEQRLADVQRLGNLGWANWNLVTDEVSWSSQVFALFDRDPADGAVRLPEMPSLALPEDVPALTRAVAELVDAGRPFDLPFRARTRTGVRHLRAVAEAVADMHGVPVEVHGFVQDLTAQRSAELALVESERAILTQHGVLQAERTLAARLQHALLPLPKKAVRPAGLAVEVAYLPAQSGLNVGGDWFSAIELPDGDALFVVGDVAGHGIDAVATMAQLRFTAKGMVITGSSLTGALARLNTLLLHSRDSQGTATIVLARYNPDERRLIWAQAGHPPPLLQRDGEVRYLGRPRGILLGACTTPVYEEAECRLQPGDRLVMYTDGLVERAAESIDRGLERLARAVGDRSSDRPGALDRLLAAMLESEQQDDVCVLDIRVPLDAGDDADEASP
ncbi:SpoIIE family protein phosphatase [Streptomyces sp. NPDC002888]|uniref:SpoIIE family protein phosphatase n=1 Tax=Streptomyces sp. NPDC002888 TaxID=3364668 RepID=UPI003695BAD9